MQPNELTVLLNYTDLELNLLLQEDASDDDVRPAPSLELVTLSRRLSGQYVDLLAHFTRQAHAEAGSEHLTEPVIGALSSLIRLNRAVEDRDLGEALSSLLTYLQGGIPTQQVARTRFLDGLRDHILGIADLLDEADADRLRSLIRFDQAAVPLLDELSKIRGIGPRRLQRLYCAGLFTIGPITQATPEEITSVTTIPLHLSAEIVRVSRTFAETRRRRSVADLRNQVQAFVTTLPDLDPANDRALIESALQSLETLQHALRQLSEEPA